MCRLRRRPITVAIREVSSHCPSASQKRGYSAPPPGWTRLVIPPIALLLSS